jgi:2-polyprenyl-3-methyl-5-hydroxy-6-metoxy-1,4-benzoquinol methylase
MSNTIVAVEKWFNQKEISRVYANENVHEYFQMQNRRVTFFKSLPYKSKFLDVGAGDGVFHIFREWPQPQRTDIEIYALAIEKGVNFDKYDGWEVCDWSQSMVRGGVTKFDGIFAAMFIEHISSPEEFIHWSASHLTENGQIYIEWPSENALLCPTRESLCNIGFEKIVGNYYDDPTHRIYPTAEFIETQLINNGFTITERGIITMPLFENELLSLYKETGDRVALQYAYWLFTAWSRYCIAVHA